MFRIGGLLVGVWRTHVSCQWPLRRKDVAQALLWGDQATMKSDWDVAAAALLVTEAGGRVSCHIGADFLFNRERASQRSLIAAGPMIHEQLIKRVNHLVLPEPGDS